jgi:hypothetical protein
MRDACRRRSLALGAGETERIDVPEDAMVDPVGQMLSPIFARTAVAPPVYITTG